jgi:hypothetical protein
MKQVVEKTFGLRLTAAVAGTGLVAALGLAGCSPDTCAAGDDACILAHLRIYDKAGNPVALTPLKTGTAISPGTPSGGGGAGTGASGTGATGTGGTGGTGGGSSSSVPTVTGFPSNIQSVGGDTYAEVTMQFTDPCGKRPGGCFGVHRGKTFPGGSSEHWTATTPVDDGQTEGQWQLQIGFEYQSPAGDEFTLDFVAWSSCDNGVDPITALEEGTAVAMGALVEADVQVAASDEGSSGGTTFTCPSPTVASTLRSGGCCTTGVCPNSCSDGSSSWYEVGGSIYTTPCSAIQACIPGSQC